MRIVTTGFDGPYCLRSATCDALTSFDLRSSYILTLSSVHGVRRWANRIAAPRLVAALRFCFTARAEFSVRPWPIAVPAEGRTPAPQVVLHFRCGQYPTLALFLEDPPASVVGLVQLHDPEIDLIVTPDRTTVAEGRTRTAVEPDHDQTAFRGFAP